jgi:hypothetical protein
MNRIDEYGNGFTVFSEMSETKKNREGSGAW